VKGGAWIFSIAACVVWAAFVCGFLLTNRLVVWEGSVLLNDRSIKKSRLRSNRTLLNDVSPGKGMRGRQSKLLAPA